MANTTKTGSTTVTSKTSVNTQKNEALEKENQQLKNRLAEVEEQMKSMMEAILSLKTQGQIQSSPIVSSYDKEIEVTNLCVGPLLLSTTGRSDGKRYDFEVQFQTIPIPESDLKEIVRAMSNTARSGRFFIDDEAFVRNAGLQSSYSNMLNMVQLSNILSMSANDFINAYRGASKVQKSIIEQMVSIKCASNEDVDANILRALSKETGKDFMSIEPLPEEYGMMKEG